MRINTMNIQNPEILVDRRKNCTNLFHWRDGKIFSSIKDYKWSDCSNHLIQNYGNHLQLSGKSQNTIKSYCQAVRLFVRFIADSWGECSHQRFIKPVYLILFQKYLKEVRGCRDSSIRTRMAALASYSDYLVAIGLLENNPVKTLRRIMKNGAVYPVYQGRDHILLTRHLRCQRFTPRLLRNLLVAELILGAGLNASEISRLNIEDVLCRGGLPTGLVVWKGRRQRLILIKDHYLRQLMNLYLVIRRLQTGSRLIKGRSLEERAYCASSIGRMLKTETRKAGLGDSKAQRRHEHVSIAMLLLNDLSTAA